MNSNASAPKPDERSRQGFNVELRKKKVNLNATKSRAEFFASTPSVNPAPLGESNYSSDLKAEDFNLAILKEINDRLSNFMQLPLSEVIPLVAQVRVAASDEENNDILIFSGIAKTIVDLALSPHAADEDLLSTILWIIANIAAGDSSHTAAIVQSGGIETLVHITKNFTTPVTIDNTTYALANIAGESAEYRIIITNTEIHTFLLRYFETVSDDDFCSNEEYVNVIKHAAWLFSNICRVSQGYRLHYETYKQFFPFWLRVFVAQSPASFHVLWSLVFCTGSLNDAEAAQLINYFGNYIVEYAFSYVRGADHRFAAMRALGNLSSGKLASDYFIKNNIIQLATEQLCSPNTQDTFKRYLRELLWAMSNLFATCSADLVNEALNASPQFFLLILKTASPNSPPQLRTDAIWNIGNLILKLDNAIILTYVQQTDLIHTLIEVQDFRDSTAIELSVEALLEIFGRFTDEPEIYEELVRLFIEKDGERYLRHLSLHRSSSVRESINKLSYMVTDDAEESDDYNF